ncbi:contractile injection system protein, VgrG/Pvc8 family, partial [Sulfurimonas sp.]|uniref:contractile injection system protein, VgrG/Pvc8 family n=1 Tax=Sulfurimonas sp. TaxID=2022749 RepID=UPI003D11BCFE
MSNNPPLTNSAPQALKELTNKINQKIVTKITIKSLGSKTFNVYKLDGVSEIGKPYEFNLTFVSDIPVEIESIVDTDVKITISDEYSFQEKEIYAKIYKASQNSVVASKYMYELKVVSPLYYLQFNKRYEIYHDKKTSDIIVEVLNRYSSLLHIEIKNKIDNEKMPIREYTTQYNQSDLEFVTMLCEEEGYALLHHYSY